MLGPVVRYSPHSISFNSTTALKEIYGFKSNVRKSDFYTSFPAAKNVFSTHSAIDKTIHARKRRVLSQAFSESALRAMEEYMIVHIREFVSRLGPSDEPMSKQVGIED